MKKSKQQFHFDENKNEYVIRLSRRRFPWWILLFLLLLLILLIPTKTKIEYTVVDKNTSKPIENAKVELSYFHTEKNEKFVLEQNSDKNGYVEFSLKNKKVYQLIFSKDKIFIENIISVGHKESYIDDKIDSLELYQLLENPKQNLLRLFIEEVVEEPDIPDEPETPKEGCRAFFSGGLVADHYEDHGISEVYVIDEFSEYVGAGEYPDNEKAFPKAVETTFDGIAIDSGTRVIIYAKKDFKGKILLDKTGPAIINNKIWRSDDRYEKCNSANYKQPLQENYPQSCREWSNEDMHDWSYGSLKVLCE